MKKKLTLKMEDQVINSAKKYARQKGKSLSGIVENYLKSIANYEVPEEGISPKVAKLKGVIKLPDDFDYKKEIGGALFKNTVS